MTACISRITVRENVVNGSGSAKIRAAIISAYFENIWICPLLMLLKL